MKKLEFESNGSKWLLVEADDEGYCFNTLQVHLKLKLSIGVFLKGITENQAIEVVGDYSKRAIQEHDGSIGNYYINHLYHPTQASHIWCKSATDSLHSLLKSKGVFLYENPAPLLSSSRLEAESNTFYNPVLFKLF